MKNWTVKIQLFDTHTESYIKIDKYNSFWDDCGNLQGSQSYLKVCYSIELTTEDE